MIELYCETCGENFQSEEIYPPPGHEGHTVSASRKDVFRSLNQESAPPPARRQKKKEAEDPLGINAMLSGMMGPIFDSMTKKMGVRDVRETALRILLVRRHPPLSELALETVKLEVAKSFAIANLFEDEAERQMRTRELDQAPSAPVVSLQSVKTPDTGCQICGAVHANATEAARCLPDFMRQPPRDYAEIDALVTSSMLPTPMASDGGGNP